MSNHLFLSTHTLSTSLVMFYKMRKGGGVGKERKKRKGAWGGSEKILKCSKFIERREKGERSGRRIFGVYLRIFTEIDVPRVS